MSLVSNLAQALIQAPSGGCWSSEYISGLRALPLTFSAWCSPTACQHVIEVKPVPLASPSVLSRRATAKMDLGTSLDSRSLATCGAPTTARPGALGSFSRTQASVLGGGDWVHLPYSSTRPSVGRTPGTRDHSSSEDEEDGARAGRIRNARGRRWDAQHRPVHPAQARPASPTSNKP